MVETISLEYSQLKLSAHSCLSLSSSLSLSIMDALICQSMPWLLDLLFTAQLESPAVFPVVASTPPSVSSNLFSKRWPMTTPIHKQNQHKPAILQYTFSVHFLALLGWIFPKRNLRIRHQARRRSFKPRIR